MTEREVVDAAPLTGTTRRWRGGRELSDGRRLYWWRELIIVVVLDIVYESVRNLSSGKPSVAYTNAMRIIDWQRSLGLWHEMGIHQWALKFTPLIIVCNYFYGSAYIGVTVLALVFLYRRFPDDYPLWRTTLAFGTLLGLIGFATFPLMPPRLLDQATELYGIATNGHTYGFVDTLVKYPTFWSFDSPTMKSISNQFAAMPSLHCGWAFWGFFVFWPRVRAWWAKALVILYPIATVFVVVATSNHYFLDAVGGAVIFLVGYGLARLVTRTGAQRRAVARETATAELAVEAGVGPASAGGGDSRVSDDRTT